MLRTQVAIIGAGPSGLLLSQLLYLHGIDSILVERQSREYVAGRIRAGVLEQGTVDLLLAANLGERMLKERLVHDGFSLAFSGRTERVDLKGLTQKAVSVYGQTEVTKDLIDARVAAGAKICFTASEVAIEDIDTVTQRCASARKVGLKKSPATLSPDAMVTTASAVKACRRTPCELSSECIPSVGWAFLPTSRRSRTN